MPCRTKEHFPFRQPWGSTWCGVACAKKVLAVHGIDMSQDDIAEELPMTNIGVDYGSLGIFFMARGFNAALKFWIRGMEPRWFGATGTETLRHILSRKICNGSKREWDWRRKQLRRFLDAGGTLTLEPVWVREIDRATAAGNPPILNFNASLRHSYGRHSVGHYIVPLGIADSTAHVSGSLMTYLDPADGCEHNIDAEQMLFWCHIWSGACLFIKPKNKEKDVS